VLQFQSKKGVERRDGLTRRDFLRAGALSAGTLSLTLSGSQRLHAGTGREDINCILLFLVGGPSQLDTWDLKPGAPVNVRGPFQPINTNVPGIAVCEHFPRMAQMTHRYALLRSVHHTAAPIHETGHQLMQTGQLFQGGWQHPSYGSVLSYLRGDRSAAAPAYVVLPAPIGNTGVSIRHGQGAGCLGPRHEPFAFSGGMCLASDMDSAILPRTLGAVPDDPEGALSNYLSPYTRQAFDLDREPDNVRDRYGRSTFGQSCLLSRRLIEHGTRLITVNMFDTVFNRITWDCHADGGSLPASLQDYKTTLCPEFDLAYSALLEDLDQRGLLATTLVVAMGEFGRTPQVNPRGGRDHWPGVWTILFAGAGVRGGQVIGASDKLGAEPRDRPITPAMVAASIYRALGIDLMAHLPGPDSQSMPLCTAEPIDELFRG
jgi:hypothetical protein